VTLIDLNADVGEECGDDAALLEIVTSANVATGAHAGGGAVLVETVRLAVSNDVAIGAHPSYPDRGSFGRTSRLDAHGLDGVSEFVSEQVREVVRVCEVHGVPLAHVKAHGALYADANGRADVARALIEGVRRAGAPGVSASFAIMGLPGSALEQACREDGIDFLAEVFADRAYGPDGRLVPRSQAGAVIADPEQVVRRAIRMVTVGEVIAVDGSVVPLEAATVCLHGDTPGAVELARRIRDALDQHRVEVDRHDRRGARRSVKADALSVSWYGDTAVMVVAANADHRAAVLTALSSSLPEHDVRAGLESVLVAAVDAEPDLIGRVRSIVRGVRQRQTPDGVSRQVTLGVRYDGVDLSSAALALGCGSADLVAAHQRQPWRVEMMGFAPGFGYLVPSGEPVVDWMRLPRRDSPRQAVPGGSVAIAAGMSAVYPASMPGGWHLIGSCSAQLFRPDDAVRPTLLQPGDEVRFVESLA